MNSQKELSISCDMESKGFTDDIKKECDKLQKSIKTPVRAIRIRIPPNIVHNPLFCSEVVDDKRIQTAECKRNKKMLQNITDSQHFQKVTRRV